MRFDVGRNDGVDSAYFVCYIITIKNDFKFMAKKITLEDLASMVKGGFDEVGKRIDNLEQGQEEIKMKLDNIVYRFEYDELKREHTSLLNRVVVLEKKVLKKR